MPNVADKLNALMKEQKTTAYKVSKEIGYTPQAVYAWANGTITPKLDAIKKLSDHFGVPITYFVDD